MEGTATRERTNERRKEGTNERAKDRFVVRDWTDRTRDDRIDIDVESTDARVERARELKR